MKKYRFIPFILSGAACVFALICLNKCLSLESQLQQLRSSLKEEMRTLSQDFTDFQIEVRRSSSLLSSESWEYGTINLTDYTAELNCAITPKDYSETDTAVSLLCNGTEYPLELRDSQYTGRIPIPLFSASEVTQVLIREGSSVTSQPLDWKLTPREDLLPDLYTSGDTAFSKEDIENGGIRLRGTGVISSAIYNMPENETITGLDLIVLLNEQEIDRLPIDLSRQGQENYLKETDSYGFNYTVPEGGFDQISNFLYYYYLDAQWNVPMNSTLEIYVEMTDSHGLCYRSLFYQFAVSDAEGSQKNSNSGLSSLSSRVYDKRGHLLYTPEG